MFFCCKNEVYVSGKKLGFFLFYNSFIPLTSQFFLFFHVISHTSHNLSASFICLPYTCISSPLCVSLSFLLSHLFAVYSREEVMQIVLRRQWFLVPLSCFLQHTHRPLRPSSHDQPTWRLIHETDRERKTEH